VESEVLQRLMAIEAAIQLLVRARSVQAFYSTEDAAEILSRSPFTVREWCRLGRVHAVKRPCGRGVNQEWMISHDELQRIRSEGLLPILKYQR
jgi:hypothetical protein